jgi:hypothetical protein
VLEMAVCDQTCLISKFIIKAQITIRKCRHVTDHTEAGQKSRATKASSERLLVSGNTCVPGRGGGKRSPWYLHFTVQTWGLHPRDQLAALVCKGAGTEWEERKDRTEALGWEAG